MSGADENRLIDEAIISMDEFGVTGKATTPYLLARIAEQSGGRSLDANIELVKSNAALAAQIASALSLQ